MRLALSQMNSTVGDIQGNGMKIVDNIRRAKAKGSDFVVFPELALCGYPPEDLLLRKDFITSQLGALEAIARETRDITAIVGCVNAEDDVYNAACCMHNGEIIGFVHKFFLPNYGVFDEDRYFQSGEDIYIFDRGDMSFSVVICEDIWYSAGPHQIQSLVGDSQLVISINASPYHTGKGRKREQILATRAFDGNFFLVYLNNCGGQDELVFDGQSLIFGPSGELLMRGPAFSEELLICDIEISEVFRERLIFPRMRKAAQTQEVRNYDDRCIRLKLLPSVKSAGKPEPAPAEIVPALDDMEELYQALITGLRDYIHKNGFHKVLIGISGGIDSALTAALAVDAVGSSNVKGLFMPSRYTSAQSRYEAGALAGNLSIELNEISIDEIFAGFNGALREIFSGTSSDVTEENLQSRIRGAMLMALSNKFGWLVLPTGNKSEIACGYCTLYGDTVGGFAPIKDLFKTKVYELSRYLNREREVIPWGTINRAPSAELRPDQKDSDSLPEYDILDGILTLYIEKDMGIDEIAGRGFERCTVERIVKLVDSNEYKRRQMTLGPKVSVKAFGKDRRLPVTNLFRPWKGDCNE